MMIIILKYVPFGSSISYHPGTVWSHFSPVMLGLHVHTPRSLHCILSEPSALQWHAKGTKNCCF